MASETHMPISRFRRRTEASALHVVTHSGNNTDWHRHRVQWVGDRFAWPTSVQIEIFTLWKISRRRCKKKLTKMDIRGRDKKSSATWRLRSRNRWSAQEEKKHIFVRTKWHFRIYVTRERGKKNDLHRMLDVAAKAPAAMFNKDAVNIVVTKPTPMIMMMTMKSMR